MGSETILANTFEGVSSTMVIPTAIGCIIGFLLLAFFGAKLVYRFFKPYLIISSSLVGSLCAATVLSILIFGDNEVMTGVFAIIGLLFSIVAMRAQFRMNRGRDLDL